MGDPELRSDEKVLLRTPGVYVKSIPFEGILTNKRIILIDRAKGLLPSKEIPLVTIKEVESGENAIRDQIITLSVIAKTGETRQMILTFSRQTGGNRIKERDAWARIIKENASSSFDQVIRKVIPGPGPAQEKVLPAEDRKYEIVRSPVRQTAPQNENRPAGTETGTGSPVRRPITTSSVKAVPPASVVDTPAPGLNVFCPKCGNKVPSESVFCNRCGSPIAQSLPVSAPVQIPESSPVGQTPATLAVVPTPESFPVVQTPETPVVPTLDSPPVVQPPVTPPVMKTPVARPLDEEIHSIEPLIEPSSVKIPADALRVAPVEPPKTHSLSLDDMEKPEPTGLSEGEISEEKFTKKGFIPSLFSAKSTDAAVSAASSGSTSDTPPPPKPPRSRSFMPGTQTVLKAAVALVTILLIAAGAMYVYPMLTSGSVTTPSGTGDINPPITPSTLKPIGTPIIRETPAPVIPSTGVYVHVNYLGGFKGSYGMPDMSTTVPGNSGDRVWEVENVSGTVEATFEKLDGSSHELLVEIYKDGKAMTSGTTTVGHGSVTLAVDTVTGIAAAPVTSGGGSSPKTTTTADVKTITLSKTGAPVVSTTTVTATTTAGT